VPQTIGVFDVVMNKRVIVQQLNGDARCHGSFRLRAVGRGSRHDEAWTQSFATPDARIAKREMVGDLLCERIARALIFEKCFEVVFE